MHRIVTGFVIHSEKLYTYLPILAEFNIFILTVQKTPPYSFLYPFISAAALKQRTVRTGIFTHPCTDITVYWRADTISRTKICPRTNNMFISWTSTQRNHRRIVPITTCCCGKELLLIFRLRMPRFTTPSNCERVSIPECKSKTILHLEQQRMLI